MKKSKTEKSILDNIPLESSLGFLALGDIAFEKWRQIKQTNNSFKNPNDKQD